ncbi:uncharacterized protein BJ171DRAFT_473527 [Polychytrium aggregatum]|uniref:uncharacterized protein n=1 Tax=Polychytrium aggregatum TaxID=110093 RepID=UPI0022FE6FA4|nr:uncharacterized protein BJ171DRAFT_473527 [Polychytrium aggregatum]KAI9206536.1 hypothetical protein BJ171DRAFT_473527 [Polychytrium aggregatum]
MQLTGAQMRSSEHTASGRVDDRIHRREQQTQPLGDDSGQMHRPATKRQRRQARPANGQRASDAALPNPNQVQKGVTILAGAGSHQAGRLAGRAPGGPLGDRHPLAVRGCVARGGRPVCKWVGPVQATWLRAGACVRWRAVADTDSRVRQPHLRQEDDAAPAMCVPGGDGRLVVVMLGAESTAMDMELGRPSRRRTSGARPRRIWEEEGGGVEATTPPTADTTDTTDKPAACMVAMAMRDTQQRTARDACCLASTISPHDGRCGMRSCCRRIGTAQPPWWATVPGQADRDKRSNSAAGVHMPTHMPTH